MADMLITNATIATMEGEGTGVLENASIAISGANIVEVGNTSALAGKYQAKKTIDATDKLVMPGLIDAHIHTGIGIIRGVVQDTDNWLQKGVWPFRERITEEEAVAGSMVNLIEGVRAGTTTFCDIDHKMDALAENHLRLGTRARLANYVIELPGDASALPVGELYPLDAAVGERKLAESLAFFKKWHGREDGRITCLWGPQAPDMVSREMLQEIYRLAVQYDTSIHSHIACGERETNQMLKRYGQRTIPFLDEAGLLDERLIGAHLSVANDEELALYTACGAGMVLCSGSEAIVDGNVPPAAEFLKHSPRLALGSDQAPGNNCCNMFNEMKFTAILNKCKYEDPTIFPAWKVLRMATIEAARTIGLGDKIGSIAPGKRADIIVLNLDKPHMRPLLRYPIRNMIPNLVYSANGSEVESVVVDGKLIMEGGTLRTVDEEQAIRVGQQAAERLCARVGAHILSFDTPVTRAMGSSLI